MKPRNTIINNEFVKTDYLLPTNSNPTPKGLLIKFCRLRMKVNYLHTYEGERASNLQTLKQQMMWREGVLEGGRDVEERGGVERGRGGERRKVHA